MRQKISTVLVLGFLALACDEPETSQGQSTPTQILVDANSEPTDGDALEPVLELPSQSSPRAALVNLEMSPVVLEPAFSAEVRAYTATATLAVEHVTLIAETGTPRLSIRVNGVPAGHCARQRIPLGLGAQQIKIEVMTASGESSVYWVTLTRSLEHKPPEPEAIDERCELSCSHSVESALQECIDQGAPSRECQNRAERAFDACVSDECEAADEATICASSCEATRERHFQACVRRGGAPRKCRVRADMAFQLCFEQKCETERGADEDDEDNEGESRIVEEPSRCEQSCETIAATGLERCVAQGGSERYCSQHARNQNASLSVT